METLTILTPPAAYDPKRAMVGNMVQQWLTMLGIPVVAKTLPLGSLLKKIKAEHDFDCFVLGYGNLSLDPDYLRNFFISRNNKPNGWNTSGYNNPQVRSNCRCQRGCLGCGKKTAAHPADAKNDRR